MADVKLHRFVSGRDDRWADTFCFNQLQHTRIHHYGRSKQHRVGGRRQNSDGGLFSQLYGISHRVADTLRQHHTRRQPDHHSRYQHPGCPGKPLRLAPTFQRPNRFGAGTTDPLLSTATLGLSQTMQYVLTITNSAAGGTGSVTFTDTIPTLITPVLSITAAQVGGGSCATATAVVGGRTRVTGTVTNALAGAICTITVTARANTNTVGTFANTVTLAAVTSTGDPDATDNSATATVTLTPVANITISKTNGLGGTVTAGQTVVYTVTVANLGPSAAHAFLPAGPRRGSGLVMCQCDLCSDRNRGSMSGGWVHHNGIPPGGLRERGWEFSSILSARTRHSLLLSLAVSLRQACRSRPQLKIKHKSRPIRRLFS